MSYTVQRNLNLQPLFPTGGPALQHLDIELTERCNNACRHCFINLPRADRRAIEKELSTVEWQGILRQASDLGALSVRFTGGEPLLRPDFSELYLFARRLGLRVKIFTNARLITAELADLFARIPPLERIEITVYGMHAETYNAAACTSQGYVEFRRGVELLLERGVPFVVKSTLLPETLADRQEFEAWAKTIPWMEEVPSYAMFFYQRGRHDKPALMRRIQQVRIDPQVGIAVMNSHPDYRQDVKRFCRDFTSPKGDRLFDCSAGKNGCVDAYGFYQPCLMLRDPSLTTDLRTSPLKEAVENSRPRLREKVATHPDYLARCARCFLHGLCDSCPAASYAEHGRLDQPVDYFCQVTHAMACDLGLLAEGEQAWEVLDWKERVANLGKDSI